MNMAFIQVTATEDVELFTFKTISVYSQIFKKVGNFAIICYFNDKMIYCQTYGFSEHI